MFNLVNKPFRAASIYKRIMAEAESIVRQMNDWPRSFGGNCEILRKGVHLFKNSGLISAMASHGQDIIVGK